MPARYRGRLLTHLRHDRYEPSTIPELAEQLDESDVEAFTKAVRQLASDNELQISPGGLVSLQSYEHDIGTTLEGEFRGTMKGFGFFRPKLARAQGDLFIPPDFTEDAMSGDTVRVRVGRERPGRGPRNEGPRFFGEVIEVVERATTSFTGTIQKRGNDYVVMADSRSITAPVIVRDAEAKYAREGDKVVFELTEYPKGDWLGEGVIVRVLGEAGQPDVETQAVIAAFGLPDREFPGECVEQARDATRRFDEEIEAYERDGIGALEMREDLTGEFVCTIDPPDAKDYDDAIHIKRHADGWELGVHIADVAHFIEKGSPLDQEAYRRGNSVYLPRLVIPMLPEVLSNGICSLQEGVLRYAKSALIRYDERGNVVSRAVSSSLIKSRKRMTYLEAQALIDGDEEEARKHAKTDTEYTPELISTVKMMNSLAKAIEKRRHAAGMISLELPDVELIHDENGKVIDAEPEDDAYTHKLIEMFMVEANEALASLFARMDVPLMRRVHPDPVPGDMEDMQQTAMVSGYKIPKNPTREELQGLLDATRGTPAARAVHMAVLRTLTKAEYSPALIGHFALASIAYAHFTSPIRRYADLTVHRALWQFLLMSDNGNAPPGDDHAWKTFGHKLRDNEDCPDESTLTEIGNHITSTEKNAEEAEKNLRKFLVLQLLSNKLGEVYPGVVTGVNPKGLFIQIDKFVVDGFVKTSDLPGDVTRSNRPPRWRIDRKSGALVDEHSGRSFNVGHTVQACIAHVDLASRTLDLTIADAEGRAAGKSMKLNLGGGEGGLGSARGAGFGRTGSQKRSQRSKSRDKRKKDFRDDRKKKGKR